MRTIEEIKNDLEYRLQELQEHINWGLGPVSLTESLRYTRNLVTELAQSQDAEIARLKAQLEWQPWLAQSPKSRPGILHNSLDPNSSASVTTTAEGGYQ
jgi:hypothetical protein